MSWLDVKKCLNLMCVGLRWLAEFGRRAMERGVPVWLKNAIRGFTQDDLRRFLMFVTVRPNHDPPTHKGCGTGCQAIRQSGKGLIQLISDSNVCVAWPSRVVRAFLWLRWVRWRSLCGH